MGWYNCWFIDWFLDLEYDILSIIKAYFCFIAFQLKNGLLMLFLHSLWFLNFCYIQNNQIAVLIGFCFVVFIDFYFSGDPTDWTNIWWPKWQHSCVGFDSKFMQLRIGISYDLFLLNMDITVGSRFKIFSIQEKNPK